MSGIYGALGLNTTDSMRVYVSTIGQRAIYDAVAYTFGQHSADMNSAMGLFVDETTWDHSRRYVLPGGGFLERKGAISNTGYTKATGSWDIAFPLEEFGAAFGGDRVSFGYMTMSDLDRHLNTTFMQNANTVRYEILRALYQNTSRTFADQQWGNLTIQCLANNDGVVYPPLLGSDSDTTGQNNYSASGYTEASISDANNPFKTLVNNLESFYGTPTGGSRIVVFVNNSTTPYVEGLTDFIPYVNRFVTPGDDQAITTALPAEVFGEGGTHTWRVLGTTNGCVVCEWRAGVPAGYLLALHLDAPKPLIKRVDLPDTGLGQGLQIVANSDVNPWIESQYSHRFGFGAGNRLNGQVMQLTTGSYAIPTIYA